TIFRASPSAGRGHPASGVIRVKVRSQVHGARGASTMLLIVLAVVLAGCQSSRQSEPEHDHASHDAETPASIRPCTEGPLPDLALTARKDRIAKGVFRAGRRIEVGGDLELWQTPYGPYWVVAENFNSMSDVRAEQAVEIYGDQSRGVR